MARNAQREDRRRRVLRDESRPTKQTAKRRTANSDRAYSEQALEQNQPRITDVIPSRGMALFYVFATGLGAIAAVESLHVLRDSYLRQYSQIDTSWMALTGSMTLSSYLAATLLTLTAIASGIVYHIRRYKIDDYKGRYRIWILVIGALLLASLDSITHAHRCIGDLVELFVIEVPWSNPAMGWMIVVGAVGGITWLRAIIEVRRSKATVFTWLLAAGCLTGSAILYLGVYQITPLQSHQMARVALFLGGVHLLMFGAILYARYVYLDAQGLKKAKRVTKKKTPAKKAEKEVKKTGLFKLPSFGRGKKSSTAKPKKAATKKKAAPKPAPVVEEDYDEDDYADDYADDYDDYEYEESYDGEPTEEELELLTSPDLTRSERKKLKKQIKQRQRRAA